MAGLMDLWNKTTSEMEGEIDQNLPAGKYVFRFGRVFKRIDHDKDNPSEETLTVSVSLTPIRPLEGHVSGWNAAKYKTIFHRFRNNEGAQLIRFLKLCGDDGTVTPEQFLASQTGRQFVADITYTPNKQEGGEPWVNVRGLRPLDVYEAQLAKVQGLAAAQIGGSDDLE